MHHSGVCYVDAWQLGSLSLDVLLFLLILLASQGCPVLLHHTLLITDKYYY